MSLLLTSSNGKSNFVKLKGKFWTFIKRARTRESVVIREGKHNENTAQKLVYFSFTFHPHLMKAIYNFTILRVVFLQLLSLLPHVPPPHLLHKHPETAGCPRALVPNPNISAKRGQYSFVPPLQRQCLSYCRCRVVY